MRLRHSTRFSLYLLVFNNQISIVSQADSFFWSSLEIMGNIVITRTFQHMVPAQGQENRVAKLEVWKSKCETCVEPVSLLFNHQELSIFGLAQAFPLRLQRLFTVCWLQLHQTPRSPDTRL